MGTAVFLGFGKDSIFFFRNSCAIQDCRKFLENLMEREMHNISALRDFCCVANIARNKKWF